MKRDCAFFIALADDAKCLTVGGDIRDIQVEQLAPPHPTIPKERDDYSLSQGLAGTGKLLDLFC